MKCQECHAPMKNLKALSTHIQFKHDNLKKEYFDKWMKVVSDGICKCCQSPTQFTILNNGYKTYCSKECMKKDYANLKSINNPMHTKSAKLNQRNTNLERYGVTQNTKRKEIKEQIKETNKRIYGVDNVSQNPIIKEKALKHREITNMKLYGVKSSLSVPKFKDKIKATILLKYGVEYIAQSEIIKNKIKATNIKRYGVEFITQNDLIFTKQQKKQYGANSYNKDLYYRGSYEKDFLDTFHNFLNIKQGTSIKYIFDDKNRIYHPDFFIPSLNLIVEIKNSWLAKKDKEIIEAKKQAVLSQGFNYIMITDKNYDEFNILINSPFPINVLLFYNLQI